MLTLDEELTFEGELTYWRVLSREDWRERRRSAICISSPSRTCVCSDCQRGSVFRDVFSTLKTVI